MDKEVAPTEIAEQRTLASSIQMMDDIKDQPSEQAMARLRTTYGIKEIPNPMLTLPADLFRQVWLT